MCGGVDGGSDGHADSCDFDTDYGYDCCGGVIIVIVVVVV